MEGLPSSEPGFAASPGLGDTGVGGKPSWETLGDEAVKGRSYDAAIEAYRQANAVDKIKDVEEIQLRTRIEQVVQTTHSHKKRGEWGEASQGYRILCELDSNNPEWQKAGTG